MLGFVHASLHIRYVLSWWFAFKLNYRKFYQTNILIAVDDVSIAGTHQYCFITQA